MKTLLLSPFFLQLLLSSSLPSSFLQITSPLSHDRTARLVSSKETKVNSPKLNNPLETHKNGNYFIGPLPPLSLPSPRQFLLPEFPGLRSAIVTMRANDTLSPHSSPPLHFPWCRYQKRYSTALNRATYTHRKSAHTHIGRNSSANKRDRKGQQESRLRDRKRVGGRIENRSGDKWFSRKSAQDILLFASFWR